MQKELAKVWPIVEGVRGYNAQEQPITMTPGTPGWMALEDAEAAHEKGAVQMMVLCRPSDLVQPGEDEEKDERQSEEEDEIKGKIDGKKKPSTRGAGTYSRSDMRARK